ncbi:MAG: ATP-grasp domain-containing protein [Xanthobacteraceae bacterium]|nr:ATP-grasp domain-containing protein [Xanthobacteraceae bacterium]
MFRTLLIANRGEIAVRIIRTAKRMGLRTVAVHSDMDRDALHVGLADVAVPIGPAPARDSYLRADRIVGAALAAGADAIHPGYGFLSERTDLPQLCRQHGLVWVGPRVEAIAAMGSKIEAKRLAVAAGVPVAPGYDGDDQSDARLATEAERIGLPVMVKASAGGGGKGMRPVHEATALRDSLIAARREAEAAFGDGRLLIEKLIMRPRHVEVQILGDKHGHLVHLFERDCSVQRNNQKLLEEAPAPNLSAPARQALHRHAVQLASAIGYDSVGTMEFMVDAATEEIFFLEMNTRLQVEHTVTEEITGLDIVEWQLRAAAGEPLPFKQDDIACRGHAIQARLTAERADQGFRPDAGKIELWSPPADVRIDSGIATGAEVGLHYDSLLAKVIAFGSDRDKAIVQLASALEQLTVLGPATNRAFLRDVLRSADFAGGRATTRLIGENWPNGWTFDPEDMALARRLAALVLRIARGSSEQQSPWSGKSGFRVLAPGGRAGVSHLTVRSEGDAWAMTVAGEGDRFTISNPDGVLAVVAEAAQGVLIARIGEVTHRFPFVVDGDRVAIRVRSVEARFEVRLTAEVALETAATANGADPDSVTATMPGLLADIMVAEGDAVEAGQTVAVLESMKLFTDLKAACAGRVTQVAAEKGKTVRAGQLIVAIEPAPAAKS